MLNATDDWLRFAYEAAQLGTWRHDVATDRVFFDARARSHYGFDGDEAPFGEVIARIHPDDREPILAIIAATLDPQGDGRCAAEHRVVHPDGTVRWVALQAEAFFSGEGADRRPTQTIGTSQDITVRKQMEQELRASEARFRLLTEHAQDLIYRYRIAPEPGFEYVSPSATTITGYTPEDHYADPQLGMKLVHPDDLPLLTQMSAGSDAGASIILRWQRKDGTVIWTEQRNRMVCDDAGRLVAIEGIARDITARKLAEEQVQHALAAAQAARAEAEQAAARTARLQAVTTALADALTREAVVTVITEHGTAATGAKASVIWLLDDTGAQLEIVGSTGRRREDLARFQKIPLDAAIPVAAAVRTREPVWLTSVEDTQVRFPENAAVMTSLGNHAYAALPLATADWVIGAVSFSYTDPNPFPPEDRAFLTTLAQQCVQALERARLYSEVLAARKRLQQLSLRILEAQEQERRRIARELHDEIGQALGALKINLHVLGTDPAIDSGNPRLAESLILLDRLIQQVRTLSLDLRPSVLDDLGLVAALDWYCDWVARRSDLTIRFTDLLGGAKVPPAVATACFRIAQEALTNVQRHAQARSVELTIGSQDEMLFLSVCDDGAGFDVARRRAQAATGRSLGLLSITERAELVNGWADISSAPGEGTEVWAWFPLEPTPAAGVAPL